MVHDWVQVPQLSKQLQTYTMVTISKFCPKIRRAFLTISEKWFNTLDSRIDVRQEITVGPGKIGKKNKRRALNKQGYGKFGKKIEFVVCNAKNGKNIFLFFKFLG